MNETIEYIQKKYDLDLSKQSPFILPLNRLTDLPQLFKELGFKKGAEIGVLEGNYSEILCKALPDATIYSIDPWKYYPLHRNFRKGWQYESIYQKTKERLSKYDNSVIIRKTSMDALADFEDESLDFVFIDADHRFEMVTNDIAGWIKKVRKGGIIAGHDFDKGARSTQYVHVYWVVPAWCEAHRIHPWIVLNTYGEKSWMWVKDEDIVLR